MDQDHIYGILGLAGIFVLMIPFGRGRRLRADRARRVREVEEFVQFQAFLANLSAEAEALRAEDAALRESLRQMGQGASGSHPLSPQGQAMRDLGLDPDLPITRKMVKRAYILAVKRTHPDCGGTVAAFARVQAAHDLLQHAMGAS